MGNQKTPNLHGYMCQLVVKIYNAVQEIEPYKNNNSNNNESKCS